jgi:DNA modification methylase
LKPKQQRFVEISTLIIPEGRHRREFPPEDQISLADSIKAHGLLHALVLREDGVTLVAGERRLKAIREFVYGFNKTFTYNGVLVEPGMVPVTLTSTDDPIALEEIELDENIKRRDLSWQERASAEARLHAIRAARAKSEGREQTLTDTAAEIATASDISLTVAQDNLRKSIIVTRAMEAIPALKGTKTLKDAFKLVQRHEETLRNAKLAAKVGETYSAELHKAFNANCLDWMALPDWQGRFDCICTDPPYGMDAQNFGDGAGRLLSIEHEYDDSFESWERLMTEWTRLSFAVCKPQAHAYVFCDLDNFHALRAMMRKAGWYVFRTPLINVKAGSGRVPLPDKGPRRQYEICLYAIKGDKLTTGLYSDVIVTQADEQLGHGAQKPVALYIDLLKRSCRPGDWVLDSFSGSGTIFPAAQELKLIAVGVEQSQASFGKGVERLQSLGNQAVLFSAMGTEAVLAPEPQ